VLPGAQSLCRDPGADHDSGEERAAEALRGQPARQQDKGTGHTAQVKLDSMNAEQTAEQIRAKGF
jgi:hypothetical protein